MPRRRVGADRTQERRDLRGHVVTVSNPDKLLFPRRRHHEGRGGPLLQAGRHADDAPPGRAARRFGALPVGIDHPGFIHKEVPDYFPGWMETVVGEQDAFAEQLIGEGLIALGSTRHSGPRVAGLSPMSMLMTRTASGA